MAQVRPSEAALVARPPEFSALALRGLFLLVLADGATLGGLVGFAGFLASDAATLHGPGTLAQRAGAGQTGSLGMVFGMMLAFTYALWPLAKDPGAVRARAVRLLCKALVVAHPAALAALGLAIPAFGYAVGEFVFLSLPIAVFATPLLLPVGRLAFSPAGSSPAASQPRAPSAPAPAPAPAARPRTQVAVALLLPFAAAFRARLPWLGGISLILWAGGLAFLAFAPLLGILFLSLAVGIGLRAAAAGSPPSPRLAAAARASVSPLPAEAASGLLCAPPLLMLDILAAAAASAVARTGTAEDAVSLMSGLTIILLFALPFALAITTLLLAAGTRTTEALRPPLCGLLTFAHVALTLFFVAVAFDVRLFGLGVDAAEPVSTLARPMAWALVAGLPLAVAVVVSGTRRGHAAAC